MFHKVSNYKRTELTNDLNIGNTTMTVNSDVFPDVPFWLTVNGVEVVEVTSKTGTTFNITRAQDDTIEAMAPAGSEVALRIIVANFHEISDAPWAKDGHDHPYAEVGHDHDGDYALTTHTHDTDEIDTTSTKGLVTQGDKDTWNAKQDNLGFTPEDNSKRGQPNGHASLVGGKIPATHLPDIISGQRYIVADESVRNGLTNLVSGDRAYQIDIEAYFIYNGTNWIAITGTFDSDLLKWENVIGTPSSDVSDIEEAVDLDHAHSNKTTLDGITGTDLVNWNTMIGHPPLVNNPHNVTKQQIGLGSVENFGIADQSEAEGGTVNDKYMTPERTNQALDEIELVTSVNTFDGEVSIGHSDIGAKPAITPKNTAFNKDFGTASDEVAMGDHVHTDNMVPIGTLLDLWHKVVGDDMHIWWKDPLDIKDASETNTYSEWKGTMVRKDSSDFPATPSDGDLVGDITVRDQHSTQSDALVIVNGATDFYSLFPYTENLETPAKRVYTLDDLNTVKEV